MFLLIICGFLQKKNLSVASISISLLAQYIILPVVLISSQITNLNKDLVIINRIGHNCEKYDRGLISIYIKYRASGIYFPSHHP